MLQHWLTRDKDTCQTAGSIILFLYAVDKGLRGQNVLQSVVIDSAMYQLINGSSNIDSVAMSLYDIIVHSDYSYGQCSPIHDCSLIGLTELV